MKKMLDLKTEDEIAAFWDEHDSTEYIDWDKSKSVRMVNLQKSAKTISIRMPVDMIETLKIQANKNDIPYQSYLKMLIADGLKAHG
ncbi:BrnA antitoxin family protein [Sulfuricurvum sp.]|uniref:BrnA antitoxin family protein n=1 Tax=Sulfuricurvum sp. TaxID=2025608 RepID=UPI002602E43F|nr:BrnA antitoxin family protein [Sulfuricurvum sp.]MDD4950872.1 BrnA antitoxin family protein [Sulfuricurvum sp.]